MEVMPGRAGPSPGRPFGARANEAKASDRQDVSPFALSDVVADLFPGSLIPKEKYTSYRRVGDKYVSNDIGTLRYGKLLHCVHRNRLVFSYMPTQGDRWPQSH